MTTLAWILLDHAVALASAAAWFTAGTAALRPCSETARRLALGLLGVAVLATAGRVVTVALLARHGWWFAQEKVLLGLPLAVSAAVVAVLLAGRPLLRPRKAGPGMLPVRGVVALFAAGLAALAGSAVTMLTGYPVTWGVALVALALLAAAVMLTGRVVSGVVAGVVPVEVSDGADAVRPEQVHPIEPAAGSALSRRRFLAVTGGAVVVTAASAGAGLALAPGSGVETGGGHGPSSHPGVAVDELRGATTPAPGGRTRRHVLTAQRADVRLASGRRLEGLTFDGQVPGPAIVATEGDLLEVTLRNTDITDGVTLHWHGYDVACGEDGSPGVTQRAVAPGEEFVYRFRADQVGTYWYHTHQSSHLAVRRGLYGALVVHPRGQEPEGGTPGVDLTLPVHTFDGALVIGDVEGRGEQVVPMGTLVRLRLVSTDSDPHRIALAGTAFRLVAVDGRDLHEPGEVGDVALRLPAGARYDLIFEMPDRLVALLVDGGVDGGAELALRPDDAPAGPAPSDTGAWPELDLLTYGTPAALPFDPDAADRHFTLVLDRALAIVDGRPAYAYTVNGRGHPSIPDQIVAEGDIVRFTVVNRGLETHPWHLHGHAVLVLSRDGTPSTGSPLWVDTFDVRPGEVWDVAFAATNPGIWMNHCHNLPHADQGMMLRLAYDGIRPLDGTAGHRAH